MSTTYLFGSNSILAKIDNFTSLGMDTKLDKLLGFTRPEIEGPRLSDLSVQTSTYGADIPRLYGTISVMGNVIQLENNKLKETVRKKKSGGKGGGGASEPTKTYSYSATFQLALCEGPIAGIRRMWCGDKLIYNAGSDDLETIIASNQAATGWKLYLGTDDQMPDPRYEAEYGVGNVSAHRGLAYIAFYDFKLADYSNTLQGAQFKVEVVTSQSTSVQLIEESLYDYIEYTSNTSFPARATYIDAQLAQFFVPLTEAPTVSAYLYEARIGTITPRGAFPALSSGTPPNYKTDVKGDFLGDKDAVFSGGGDFSGVDGHIQRRNDVFVGYSDFSTSLYYKQLGGPEYSVLLAGVRAVVLDTNGAAYAIFETEVKKYEVVSGVFTESGSWPVAMDLADVSDCRAWVDDGLIYIYGGQLTSNIYTFNISTGEVFSFGSLPFSEDAYHSAGFHVESGLVIEASQTITDPKKLKVRKFNLQQPSVQLKPLGEIIQEECAFSGLLFPEDIDVTLVDSMVRGYRVSGGSIRSALEPLQTAYPLDVRPHGYKIQFLPRGQASVATIPWEDLGATAGDTPDDIFQQSREMDTQLPAKTVVKYLDAAREYAVGEQFSERLNTEAVNKVERDLALVLTADEAAGIAEMLNFMPWLERTPASFTLPPPYRYLEAGDVVTVVSQAATYEIRLTEANETQDGRLECQALPNRAALYTPAASGSEGVPPAGTIGLAGESLFVPLDIPVIDETLQNAPGFVGVMTGYSAGWPGALAVRSADGGQTWIDLQAYSGMPSIGYAVDALPVSACTLIDQRTLTVGMISGAPESITRDQMLAGSNYAAYGVDGRWEIVRFQNADLQANGSYLLSGFVRGEKGTEWATGLHAANDYFVLLDDPDNAFIGMAVASIAVPATYRGVTSGASVDDATDVPFTYRGVNLECLSPVYAKGSRDGSSNFTGTFTRRSRLSSSWWATGVAAPVGETSEAYEIDVMDGSAVARTITASTPSFAYTAAEQSADFGSAQASITFRIYQLSATVGRGYPLEVTL